MATSGTYYVYEHWRLDRDECFYVGKGRGGRAYSMKNRNRHHQAIVAKMARIGSAFEVRIVASGLSEQEAFDLERERIAFWRTAGVDLANLTNGGEGVSGLKHSEETKKLWSQQRKGRSVPLEGRIKRSLAMRGVPKSKEHAANAGRAGGIARKGIKWSPEAIEARRIAILNSDRVKKANLAKRKTVVCLNTGDRYNGTSEAAFAHGVSKYSVQDCCSGRTKHTKGLLVFKYEVEA
jgi:hypothetical protein